MLSTGDEQTKKFEGYHASHATRVTACNFHLTYKGMESGVCFTFLKYMFVSCMYACVCCETNAGCAGTTGIISHSILSQRTIVLEGCFLYLKISQVESLISTRLVWSGRWWDFSCLAWAKTGHDASFALRRELNREPSDLRHHEPSVMSVMWSLETGNGRERRRGAKPVWRGTFLWPKARNVNFSYSTLQPQRGATSLKWNVQPEAFRRLSEGFQKASRFIGNWMEIGIGPEEFWIMESWCSHWCSHLLSAKDQKNALHQLWCDQDSRGASDAGWVCFVVESCTRVQVIRWQYVAGGETSLRQNGERKQHIRFE